MPKTTATQDPAPIGQLEPSTAGVDAARREFVFEDPDRTTPDQFPCLGNLSSSMTQPTLRSSRIGAFPEACSGDAL